MLRIGLFTSIACLVLINSGTVRAQCWSSAACIDVGVCASKGGVSTAGLCSGASNIQCCTCNNCMDAGQCTAQNGISSSGICSGAGNIQCCSKSTAGAYKPVNAMLTQLATILRDAGLNVVEEPGWQTRGHGVMSSVKGILVHHTAGPATGEFPSKTVVRDGRSDLPGPLAQLGLGRSGTWYIIAAGRSYHAGSTLDDSIFGNSNAIGIEAEGTGVPADEAGHQNWPEVQWQSYVRGVKALQAAYGIPTARVLGHKEAAIPAGRKPDPNFSMKEFRAALG